LIASLPPFISCGLCHSERSEEPARMPRHQRSASPRRNDPANRPLARSAVRAASCDSDVSELCAVGGSRARPRNLEPTRRSSSDVQNSIFPDIDFTTWLTGSPEKLNSVRLSSAPLRLNRGLAISDVLAGYKPAPRSQGYDQGRSVAFWGFFQKNCLEVWTWYSIWDKTGS